MNVAGAQKNALGYEEMQHTFRIILQFTITLNSSTKIPRNVFNQFRELQSNVATFHKFLPAKELCKREECSRECPKNWSRRRNGVVSRRNGYRLQLY